MQGGDLDPDLETIRIDVEVKACVACHGRPEISTIEMLRKYGPAINKNGPYQSTLNGTIHLGNYKEATEGKKREGLAMTM